MKEIQSLIMKNRSPRMVRLVISMLNKGNRISPNLSQEAEILLIGFTGKAMGKNLIDVIDNPPSFTKAVYRMLDLILSYFKYPYLKIMKSTSNIAIRRACSKAWDDFYVNCLADESKRKKKMLLIEPLINVIKGGAMVSSQETAC